MCGVCHADSFIIATDLDSFKNFLSINTHEREANKTTIINDSSIDPKNPKFVLFTTICCTGYAYMYIPYEMSNFPFMILSLNNVHNGIMKNGTAM